MDERGKELLDLNDQLVAIAAIRKRRLLEDANAAHRELCAALGLDLTGSSIDGGGTHLRISVKDVKLITARLAALKAGNVLADGHL